MPAALLVNSDPPAPSSSLIESSSSPTATQSNNGALRGFRRMKSFCEPEGEAPTTITRRHHRHHPQQAEEEPKLLVMSLENSPTSEKSLCYRRNSDASSSSSRCSFTSQKQLGSNNSNNKKKKHVTFTSLEIRSYNVTVADSHPCSSSVGYSPLSCLGWDYFQPAQQQTAPGGKADKEMLEEQQHTTRLLYSVDQYEALRQAQGGSTRRTLCSSWLMGRS